MFFFNLLVLFLFEFFFFLVHWLFGWLLDWFGLGFFLFLFCSLLIYHFYWKVVELFRLQTYLLWLISLLVCPWKMSFHKLTCSTSLGKWSNTEDSGSLFSLQILIHLYHLGLPTPCSPLFLFMLKSGSIQVTLGTSLKLLHV